MENIHGIWNRYVASSFLQELSVEQVVKFFRLRNMPLLLLLLLITQLLPRDGGMAEDHGAPEAGQLSRTWTRGRREKESCQRVSGTESP